MECETSDGERHPAIHRRPDHHSLRRIVSNPQHARRGGYTLIELVATVSVAAILTAIAIPTFRYVTNSARVSTEINALLGDLEFARMEAVKEGSTVSVCASLDGKTCSQSTDWSKGWIVWSDVNANQTVDAGEPMRSAQAALRSGDSMANGPVKALSFNRDGFVTRLANTVQFTLHDATGNSVWTRCLSLSRLGKMTTTTYTAGSCY